MPVTRREQYERWFAIGERAQPFLQDFSGLNKLSELPYYLANHEVFSKHEADTLYGMLRRFSAHTLNDREGTTVFADLKSMAQCISLIRETSPVNMDTSEPGIGVGLVGFMFGAGLRRENSQ